MIRIIVAGDAIPAARPRFSGHAYQPKRNRDYRARVQTAAYSAMAIAGHEPMTGELSAVVKLYRRYKTTARIFGDVDNHLKSLFDGLNGIVFADDSQIVQCEVSKHTDKKNPRAEIEIRKVVNQNETKSKARKVLS